MRNRLFFKKGILRNVHNQWLERLKMMHNKENYEINQQPTINNPKAIGNKYD